jgi:ferritin-like protein
MPVETRLPRDTEEVRLLESCAPLDIQEKAAVHQLSHPSHSMLPPEYKQLAEALEAMQVKSAEKKCAVRAYRQKMRDRATSNLDTKVSRSLEPIIPL